MEKLSRRSFFRLVGGGIATAVIAPKLLLDKVINIPVEFGWTWYLDKSQLPKHSNTFADMITKTLRENAPKLRENIASNNALLMKLKDGTKVQLNIERIPEKLQNERMIARADQRFKEKHLKSRVIKPIEDETAVTQADGSIYYPKQNRYVKTTWNDKVGDKPSGFLTETWYGQDRRA